jgi:hypothetical protein
LIVLVLSKSLALIEVVLISFFFKDKHYHTQAVKRTYILMHGI